MSKYLAIAFREGGSDAFRADSSNDFGADRSFLSGALPHTYSIFARRWYTAIHGTTTNFQQANAVTGTAPPHPAAPIFQGIDYSGNVALTSRSGTLSLEHCQIFADLGFQTAGSMLCSCTAVPLAAVAQALFAQAQPF